MDAIKQDIIQAIHDNNDEKLKVLLSQKGTEITYITGEETPLHHAATLNKPNMVDIILHYQNIDINAENSYGRTSLHEACNKPFSVNDIIIKLITHGANVNLRDKRKITPLMRAASYGNVQVMILLIESGADIDVFDDNNRTALIFALEGAGNNLGALNVLLRYNANLSISWCPQYNPLLFAIINKPKLVEVLIPFCKNLRENTFSEALEGAIATNQIDVFRKLIKFDIEISVENTTYLLNSVISIWSLSDCFDLLWRNIKHKLYVNPRTFSMIFYKIFRGRIRVPFFKRSLKIIIDTPEFNCDLNDQRLVISTIFVPKHIPGYDWNLCKDILLEFCEYVNKQGLRLKNYDLIMFVKYFQGNCQFMTELLAVFFKYDPALLVTMFDIINLSRLNDLKLISQLLYYCFDFDVIYFSRNIYEPINLHAFSENTLRFFVRRFTPTKSVIKSIRGFKKFNHVNFEVPTLTEIARNTLRKAIKNNKPKAVIENLYIASSIADIIYFKHPVNYHN